MERIILASGSPRRSELLTQIGIPFEVMVSQEEEVITGEQPGEIVEALSLCKAKAVARRIAKEEGGAKREDGAKADGKKSLPTVLGADTVVVLDGKILGKPHSEEEAKEMLRALQGRSHQVYTGVSLVRGETVRSFHEKTDVLVYPMSEEEIDAYVKSGDPMDKAGAYGIQGAFAAHIRGISGDYYTVMGLPIGRVWQELKTW